MWVFWGKPLLWRFWETESVSRRGLRKGSHYMLGQGGCCHFSCPRSDVERDDDEYWTEMIQNKHIIKLGFLGQPLTLSRAINL